jgi:ubiquinone/menaquinone biosynthesis C-methylase UbiE
MGIYSTYLFPRFFDFFMDRPCHAAYRSEVVGEASGRVLEIGVGTGLNLPHYASSVDTIVTVDPNPGMNKQLERRVLESGVTVEKHILGGENLPFDDDSFDYAISTWTLCSIAGADRAVAELFRVLKPGGKFRFLEHGISPDAGLARWQQRLNPIQKILADGCRLDVDIDALINATEFSQIEINQFYMEETPRLMGYMYRGQAIKPG